MAARADSEPGDLGDLGDDDFFFDDLEDAEDASAREAPDVEHNETSGKRRAKADRDGGHRAAPVPARERFKRWRKQRPFVPGLLLILSGVVMLAPAYFTIQVSDLLVMISTISGVSTLLIGAALIMFGVGMWLQPYAAPYLGVMGILVAIIALPTSNIGGFIIGSLLGIVGGALGLAWEKHDTKTGGKHTRNKKQSQAPPEDEGFAAADDSTAVDSTPPRGGSTKIDLSALRNPKALVVVLATAGLIVANTGDEPAVNAQEPAPLSANLPQLPTLPTLPALPSLPSLPVPPPLPSNVQLPSAPQLPQLPQLPTPTGLPLPPDPRDMLTYPDLEPTRTIAPQNLSTITADHVAITGNVRATMGMVNIGDVPTRTLILTGDSLTARNLSLEVPGFAARGLLTTGQVETKVYDGPVTVVATGLTATPVVAGVPTLPVTVDLRGPLGDILAQLGVPDAHPVPNVPVPNFVMDRIALGGVNMQMVSLEGLHLHAPAVQLRVPK